VIIDAVVTNTPIFLRTSASAPSSLAGSIVLDNVKFTGVTSGVVDGSGSVVLAGGDKTIRQWAQGNVYTGTGSTPSYVQATINAPTKPASLLDSTGKIFSRSRPQYLNYAPSRESHASPWFCALIDVLFFQNLFLSRLRVLRVTV
jgi:glucan 1,3-beta-glucosidase